MLTELLPRMKTPFKSQQVLLFIGDSITDCGRTRPVGERSGNGLGQGYVSLIDSILGAAAPERPLRVLNTGIGGDRVTDLAARWQTDVLDLEPDWLSVMIGINDVWRQFDGRPMTEQVSPQQFESDYRALLLKIRPQLDGLVLMAPFFLEANRKDPMRAMMDSYGAITAELAAEFEAVFVDTQAAFDNYLAHQPSVSQLPSASRLKPIRFRSEDS